MIQAALWTWAEKYRPEYGVHLSAEDRERLGELLRALAGSSHPANKNDQWELPAEARVKPILKRKSARARVK